MEGLQTRINSFKKSKRVKNPTKPSSTTNLKWPHPPDFKVDPESLAEAGFYYNPSYDDPDNVTCYFCEKDLCGWEEDDDPFLLHWTKCAQTCCWASVRCGLGLDVDKSGRFVFPDKTRLPNHKSMEKARLETFSAGKGWIHDKIKNHGASSKMMARAGFVFTPQQTGDDLTTCLYCNTSLSGWDADDDPLEEHRTRAAKSGDSCPFFDTASNTDVAQSSKPASRSQTTKPPSKSQSKPLSRSTSHTNHQDVLLPTKTFDGDAEVDVPESSNTTQATAKTPRKPRSTSGSRKSSAKTSKSRTRSSSRSGLKNVEEEEEEEEEAPVEAPPTVKKKAQSRSKSVARSEGIDQTEAEDEPPPTIKKKPRSKSIARFKIAIQSETEDEPSGSLKPSRSRAKSKALVETELEEEMPRKSSRSRSKASIAPATESKPSRTKAKPKVVETESEEEPPHPPVAAKPKPKHQRTTSRSKAKAPPPEESDLEKDEPPVKPNLKQRTASRSKAKAPPEESESEQVSTVVPLERTASRPKPQIPNAKDLFNEDLIPSTTPLPPDSEQMSTMELPPLFVPKRSKTVKVPALPAEAAPPEEARKPGRPKAKLKAIPCVSDDNVDVSETTSSVDIHAPFAPVSINPSRPSAKENAPSRSRQTSQNASIRLKQQMKVVEISSDEDTDDIPKKARSVPQSGKENSNLKTHVTGSQPSSQVSSDSHSEFSLGQNVRESVTPEPGLPAPPLFSSTNDTADVHMEDDRLEEPDSDIGMQTAPSTPQKPMVAGKIQRISTTPPPINNCQEKITSEPLFTPPLSKLPFVPLHALNEAELDMSVEEWVRYQMEVEHDKFRRDGERELEKFKKRAEEVRKVIEGL